MATVDELDGVAKHELTPTELLSQVIHDQGQQIAAANEKLKQAELDLQSCRAELVRARGDVLDTQGHKSELLIFRAVLQDWVYRLNRMAGVKEDK